MKYRNHVATITQKNEKTLPILLIGFIAITLLDTLGSIASREMNFLYSSLAPLSFVIFISTGFWITLKSNWKLALVLTPFLGIFDATIGVELSKLFNPNIMSMALDTLTRLLMVFFMAIVSTILGLVGVLLAMGYLKIRNLDSKNQKELL